MELDKIEKEIKSQLDLREIQPSPVAWDRLDAMLTAAESKKEKPKFNWIYIAASVIGFFMLGYVFYNNSGESAEVSSSKAIVTNEAQSTKTSAEKKQQIPVQIQKESQVIAENKVIPPKKKPSISSHRTNNRDSAPQQNQLATALSTNKKIEAQPIEKLISTPKTDEINPSKPESQLAEISTKTMQPTVKVNPSTLLSEVDKELTFSFREKVIRKIDKNYKTVKLALANRNQQ